MSKAKSLGRHSGSSGSRRWKVINQLAAVLLPVLAMVWLGGCSSWWGSSPSPSGDVSAPSVGDAPPPSPSGDVAPSGSVDTGGATGGETVMNDAKDTHAMDDGMMMDDAKDTHAMDDGMMMDDAEDTRAMDDGMMMDDAKDPRAMDDDMMMDDGMMMGDAKDPRAMDDDAELRTVEVVTVASGDTLGAILRGHGLLGSEVAEVISALGGVTDPHLLRPGQELEFRYAGPPGGERNLESLSFRSDSSDSYVTVSRGNDRVWTATATQ